MSGGARPDNSRSRGNSSSPIRLSKSKIAAFEHCPKRLWLQVHRPELAKIDEATLQLFARGHLVGQLARIRCPSGVLVADDHRNLLAALEHTRQLLNASCPRPIFEAAFQRDGVVIRADILEPDESGGWKLAEVKNSGSVKPYQLLDVATQAWVMRGSDICISSISIRHVQRPLRSDRDLFRTRFIDADVTADVLQLVFERSRVVDHARAVLRSGEPDIAPGRHCVRPFRCEFREHCSAQAGE
jgi:hypothetical protein